MDELVSAGLYSGVYTYTNSDVVGTLWMNWFLLGCILVSIPILTLML